MAISEIYFEVIKLAREFATKNSWQFINDYWKENDDAYNLCKDIDDFYVEATLTPISGGLNLYIWYEYCRLDKKHSEEIDGELLGATSLLTEVHPVDKNYYFKDFYNNPPIIWRMIKEQIELVGNLLLEFTDFDSMFTAEKDVKWLMRDIDFSLSKPKKRIMKELLRSKAGITDIRIKFFPKS